MWQIQKDATVSKNLDHYITDTPSYNTLICYNYEYIKPSNDLVMSNYDQ